MPASIFDASVLVRLAQEDAFERLRATPEPRLVPDEVDEELRNGAHAHPEHAARYEAAKAAGLLRVHDILEGSAARAHFLRLRSTRTSPMRNRGEDACVALALTLPDSFLYMEDGSGTRRAIRELGSADRIRASDFLDAGPSGR